MLYVLLTQIKEDEKPVRCVSGYVCLWLLLCCVNAARAVALI